MITISSTTSKNTSKRAMRFLLGTIFFFAFVVTDSTVGAEKISSKATTVEDAEDFFVTVEQQNEEQKLDDGVRNHGGGLEENKDKRKWRRLMSEKLQSKIEHIHNRKLFDSSEHAAAGEGVTLPGAGPGGTNASGTDALFYLVDDEKIFSFGNLTYIAGDVMGPHKESLVICLAKNYEDRKKAAKNMMNLFEDDYLAGKERMGRVSSGMQQERDAADATNVTFQKHVVVHQTSFAEFDKIDDYLGWDYGFCATSATAKKSVKCMLSVNYDHFGECAKKAHQIFHDLALEAANKGDLNKAYFFEGLGSHSLTDLFSSGHIRTPSFRLRTSHCSSVKGGLATNQMHDEDSYNGLYMTNRIKSDKWWVFGDSFYFEPFSKDNRKMMLKGLQGGIDEVYAAYAAYQARTPGSSEAIKGSSNGYMDVYPSRSLDFIPDLAVSQNEISEYWDVNTCPMWYDPNPKENGKMYRRAPWFRIRSEKGRSMGDSIPASNKFGLFNSTFPLVPDENQLTLSGKIDLKVEGCWFKFSPDTIISPNECSNFGLLGWEQSEMFYSPELNGFLPPTLATCQAFTKGGRNEFDNDCYDVLEVVSRGQNCDDLKTSETCGLLTPRCVWSDGTCAQGSCVAYSREAGEIVPGDPTPPVLFPPTGFFMSFQGTCALHVLEVKSYQKMPGKNDVKKCAELCEEYTGPKGECTGIAVDFGAFKECYLYFNNACQRADGSGFLRCASHGLQTFHKGLKSTDEIMSKCDCSTSWYYKDQNVLYSGCQAVQSESWGTWCYVANPDECELGMYSSTQPDQKWRYCDESTCESFECPVGVERRDTVICYDDSCDVGDCCVYDATLKCEDQNSKKSCEDIACKWIVESDNCVKDSVCVISNSEEECKEKGCAWQDGYFSDACTEPLSVCVISKSEEVCKEKGCAWQDGYFSDTCTEPFCENWYNELDCRNAKCAWQDGYISDGCSDGLCKNWNNEKDCKEDGCAWQNGYISDGCARPKCINWETEYECNLKKCAWQDGYTSDACKEPICDNWYTEAECRNAKCAWQDGSFSDACADPICINWYTEAECRNAKCAWQNGSFSNACADPICINWYTEADCRNAKCAWQDGYTSDACKEGKCENFYNKKDCQNAECKWNDPWYYPDYCSLNRRLEADEADEIDDNRRLDTDEIDKDNWEDALDNIAADKDIISNLVSPLSLDTQSMSGILQPKLDAMMQALMAFDDYEEQLVVFSTFGDGRFYSLTSCDRGRSCWYKYPGAEYTFGVVEPGWNEFINVFKVVAGKVDLSDNGVSEFGVPDFPLEEFNVEDKVWYGEPGWTAPFTCLLMHPDTTEICEAYTMVGADFTLGIQINFSEDGDNEDEGENEDNVTSKSSKDGKKYAKKGSKTGKKGKRGKSGKKGKSSKRM